MLGPPNGSAAPRYSRKTSKRPAVRASVPRSPNLFTPSSLRCYHHPAANRDGRLSSARKPSRCGAARGTDYCNYSVKPHPRPRRPRQGHGSPVERPGRRVRHRACDHEPSSTICPLGISVKQAMSSASVACSGGSALTTSREREALDGVAASGDVARGTHVLRCVGLSSAPTSPAPAAAAATRSPRAAPREPGR